MGSGDIRTNVKVLSPGVGLAMSEKQVGRGVQTIAAYARHVPLDGLIRANGPDIAGGGRGNGWVVYLKVVRVQA
jgi:hypothetical protein